MQRSKPFNFKQLLDLTSFLQEPVRLGMQIAFGRVRRKTAPTGSGGEDSIGKWRIECLCAKVFSFQLSVFSCQQLGVRSQPESFLQERAYD